MTGLMNRMVQRAQGRLPSVEPLVRSHQTAAFTLSSPLEDDIAIATSSSVIASETKHQPPSFPSAQSQHRSVTDHAVETSPLGHDIQPAPRASLNGEHDSVGLEPHQETLPLQTKLGTNAAQNSEFQQQRDPLIHEPRTVKHDVHEPVPELMESSARGDAPPPTLELSPKKREALAPPEHNAIAPARQEATPVAPLDTATEHTEIHITIGSIELRGPQTEAPRKPTPFKPRVTLDDYLRRRSGAGS